jgi:hypothetical protein
MRASITGRTINNRKEDHAMKRMLSFFLSTLSLVVTTARAAEPQHGIIIGLDAKRQSITAINVASGKEFKFTVKDPAVFKSAKLCEDFEAPVSEMKKDKDFIADFGKADPKKPCCTLTTEIGGAGQVLGIKPHAKHEGVTFILTELKRASGDLVTATYLYCNAGPKVEIRNELVDRVSKATLVDGASKTQHNVVRVKNPGRGDSWLMADHGQATSTVYLNTNGMLKSWMKFTAPAGDKATLYVPGASEPFEDVPIAR